MESQEAIAGAAATEPPLFVDLDGTLVKTDLLLESFMAWIKQNPANLFVSLLWLAKGKAHFKSELAKRVDIPVHLLPYEIGLLDFLKGEAVRNRAIYLATASDQKYANAVARHLGGIFRGVVASDGQINLKGAAKLAAIVRLCDGKQFDYAGDSTADTVIWRRARQAILVNPSRALSHGARGLGNVVRVFEGRSNLLHVAIKAMRIGQWPKNLLLFVPLLAGHVWRMDALATTCLGFVSFSLTASATYILNDLFDVASDRAHPRKRSRTFASGLLSPQAGLALSAALLAAGFGLAIAVGYPFVLVLLVYLLGTVWYSVLLKQYVLIDVLALAGLYTVRLFAGAVPIGITLSFWLMAFSTFVFFSLALVKRCSELIASREAGRARSQGRDYQSADLAYLSAMGIASGYASVLVLALFINSPDVALRYSHPQVLWFICALLLYWLSRLWIKTGRNEMHDDPIVFTLHDRGSRYVIGAAIVAVVLAL